MEGSRMRLTQPKCRNYLRVRVLALFFTLLVNHHANATYNIDDSTLYRVSFNDFGVTPDANNPFNDENIKLHQFSSKVVKTEADEADPSKSVFIPDHSDMKLDKLDTAGSEEEQLDTITMLSQHGEKYVCTIPRTDSMDKDKAGGKSPYEGHTALALLEPLFVSKSCAYRLEHYWTYELCHGRFLRQYHEERDGKTVKVFTYSLNC